MLRYDLSRVCGLAAVGGRGGLVRHFLTEGWGRNLQDAGSVLRTFVPDTTRQLWLVEAQQGWTRLNETADTMQSYLVDHDPAHLGWAGETTMTVNAGRAGHRLPTDIVSPARCGEAHPAVPREALQLRILLSYHYFKAHDLDRIIPQKFQPPYPQIFADSGAFSA